MQPIDPVNKFKEKLMTYSDFFSFSFQDLLKLSQKDKNLFLSLYYNRTADFEKVNGMLKNIKNRGDNILITGDAGKGKSNFMYRIFFDEELIENYSLYPVIVDYGETNKINICLTSFIEQVDKYFKELGIPVNNLKSNTDEHISQNFNILQKHLVNHKNTELKKYLLIFLDDLDYVEEELFELLEYFLPFASSQRVSIVLSARPPLLEAIRSYDGRFATYFTRSVQRIKLDDLVTSKILSRRLAPILVEQVTHPIKHLIKKLFEGTSRYRKLLNLYGIENLEQLEKFDLPFTHLYNNFMTSITNGNIREIFNIAHDSLIFILDNYNELQTTIEMVDNEPQEKKVITQEQILQLFSDGTFETKKGYLQTYKIININEHKSKMGNSLIYNILESIRKHQHLNEDLFDDLLKLGHSKEKVLREVEILSNKTQRMLLPKKILPAKMEEKASLYKSYEVSVKGNYYLSEIADWPEYIKRFGNYGNKLSEL